MRLSKQIHQDRYRINKEVYKYTISCVVNTGPFFLFPNPGVPIVLPLGKRILANIEQYCFSEFNNIGFDQVDIPLLISNDVLNLGDNFSEGFLDQFVFLTDRLKHYHLLSTPEPYFINLLKSGLLSYRQLPLNYIFQSKFYRQLRSVDNIMKTREFSMLAGMSVCFNNGQDSLDPFIEFTDKLTKDFDIQLKIKRDLSGNFLEYFYPYHEGIDSVDDDPAISLSMAYKYQLKNTNKSYLRFRNNLNCNEIPIFVTYGMGLQRLFFIILDRYRDLHGFNLPIGLRPFDASIIFSKNTNIEHSYEFIKNLHLDNSKVMLDDRENVSMSEKLKFSDYIGVPNKYILTSKYLKKLPRGEV